MKIFNKIGLICCAILLGVGSFFLPRLAKTQSFIAKADSVVSDYTFNGSRLYIPVTRRYQNTTLFYNDYLIFGVSFTTDHTNNNIILDLSNTLVYYQQNWDYSSSVHYDFKVSPVVFYNNNGSAVKTYSLNANRSTIELSYTSVSAYSQIFYSCSTSFTGNIGSIVIGSENYNSSVYNFVKYIDLDNNALSFYFKVETINGITEALNTRTYYLSGDLSDNQMYNQGYNDGLQAEQNNIYQEGRQDGFNGGYNQGYQEGVEAASNNTFFSLIGAAVDVPITALSSLLNFTFLGVNLLAFVTSILTLALIIFVIKKFMGKG